MIEKFFHQTWNKVLLENFSHAATSSLTNNELLSDEPASMNVLKIHYLVEVMDPLVLTYGHSWRLIDKSFINSLSANLHVAYKRY